MRWLPVGGVAEPGEQLELHVAEIAGLAQLLLDGVPQQAAHLDEREVGAELRRRQGAGDEVMRQL